MYWQDEPQIPSIHIPDNVMDVLYGIECRRLPVDHAYALSQAVQKIFPWFAHESPPAGLHTIHVAESGNGWIRPEDFIHPSRRTKLTLRLPKHRLSDAAQLSGKTLDISGNTLTVGAMTLRPLSSITTLFSRYIIAGDGDEQRFLEMVLEQLDGLAIHPKKMLCGIEKTIHTPEGSLKTRSLMLAELSIDESLQLQQQGLGPQRPLGCGMFIPHKDIQELK